MITIECDHESDAIDVCYNTISIAAQSCSDDITNIKVFYVSNIVLKEHGWQTYEHNHYCPKHRKIK
tara:strand:+ start:1357 stop:1554 length:198 start_codon:yes stop_codon:yes gene_type:complete